jgi:elongation factor P
LITTNQLKNGMTLKLDDVLFNIVEFQHVKPGKGPAFVRTKLRRLRDGAVIDKTFRAGEKVEQAMMETNKAHYSYADGSDYVFMDTDTYEQYSLPMDTLGELAPYLKENIEVSILFHDGKALSVELPVTVDLKVDQTDPGVKGDTAQGGSKPATLETGAVVQVPLFVEPGDTIRVDTRSGDYVTRV